MSEDTFGHRLRAYMLEEQRRLGMPSLTPEQWVAAANAYHSADAATARMVKTKRKTPKTQLFMVLCSVCAIDYNQSTRSAVRNIDECLTQLRDVSPDLTVEELAARAKTYKTRHPTWPLTPRALVKNWGTLCSSTSLPSKVDEPVGWRDKIDQIYTAQEREDAPATLDGIARKPWSQIAPHLQQSIIRRMKKLAQAPAPRDPVSESYFG